LKTDEMKEDMIFFFLYNESYNSLSLIKKLCLLPEKMPMI